jgi:Ala-tRNA(Pro) deacylase
MSIAPTLQRYLGSENIRYDVIAHQPTASSTRTAEACHISGDRLAKGVVLRRDGGYLLAVVPASHHIHFSELRSQFGDNLELAEEGEIDQLFPDCAHGAVPAIGQCYGLSLVIDDCMTLQPEVFVEAGDHETLLRMDREQFSLLTGHARHGCFSGKPRTGADPSIVWG